jgi:hypothetical protein
MLLAVIDFFRYGILYVAITKQRFSFEVWFSATNWRFSYLDAL